MMSDILITTEVSTKAQKALHASERKLCATRCIPNKCGYCGSTGYADGYSLKQVTFGGHLTVWEPLGLTN